MVFPIAGGNESKGYEISNSLRFNDDDGAYLRKTLGTATNRKILTFSTWVKRSNLTLYSYLLVANTSAPYSIIGFDNADQFSFQLNAGSGSVGVFSTAKFRDPSAWYHFVAVLDTTQGTSSNRVKIYVNGSQITSLSASSYPDQNSEWNINNSVVHDVGGSGAVQDFDGYMADTYFIDGQALDPTYFGETDDNGVWIPKKYTGTFGNNGFKFEYKETGTSANSSGMGADTSGNDNHFTPTNLAATDVTEDTPTNNFATLNPLESDRQQGGAATFAEGNLQITTSYVDANYQRYPQVYSTQAVSSGKWYFEMKISTSDVDSFIGIHSPDNYASDSTTNPYGGYASTGCIFTSRGAVRINDGQTTGLGTWSQNDIVGCALDIDNDKVYFHRNGTYVQSGDPAGNSGGQAIPSNTTYGFTVGGETASDSGTMQVNFGNPVHTISSGNTDGKYGNFEYAVPSGFYAVCTKRLAEFG
jgi:hypothetical protein